MATFKMLLPFQLKACGFKSPKALLPQLPTLPGLWVTGQGPHWPCPGPEAFCACAYSSHTPANTHQTPICGRCLSSQLRRERGSGRPGKALKNPGLSLPQLTHNWREQGQGGEGSSGATSSPSSYLPAASLLLPQPEGAWGLGRPSSPPLNE